MSIKAWGAFILKSDVTDLEKIHFAFKATGLSSEYFIGLKLGWNVIDDYKKEFKNNNHIPFELTDNPMTNVAEILFIGDGVKLRVRGIRIDSEESLQSRMNRIQLFFQEIMKIENTSQIVLQVDSGFGEIMSKEIPVSRFTNAITELYTHDRTWTPTVRFIINR